jgi:hypothetical protein
VIFFIDSVLKDKGYLYKIAFEKFK